MKSSRVGPGVSELRVGDQIYGVTNPQFVGAYAEYALASAGMISRKPTSLTYVEAASVPVIAVTAWQALFDHAQLKAGQTVVIHGAAGNVGAYAVQIGPSRGSANHRDRRDGRYFRRARPRRKHGDRLPDAAL